MLLQRLPSDAPNVVATLTPHGHATATDPRVLGFGCLDAAARLGSIEAKKRLATDFVWQARALGGDHRGNPHLPSLPFLSFQPCPPIQHRFHFSHCILRGLCLSLSSRALMDSAAQTVQRCD